MFPKEVDSENGGNMTAALKELDKVYEAVIGDRRNSGTQYDGTSTLPESPIMVGFMKYFYDCLEEYFLLLSRT